MSEVYNITQSAEKLSLTPFYVRKCIKSGKLEATKQLIENTQIERYVVTAEAIESFANREKKSVGKREDGRTKFTHYMTRDEEKAIRELLEANGFSNDLLARANPPKTG